MLSFLLTLLVVSWLVDFGKLVVELIILYEI